MSRCGSRVAASDMTTKVTCPGCSCLVPWDRDRIRHFGGKMLETRTRLHAAIPAERSARSNQVSFSRWLPAPLVKNISLGTNPTTSRSFGWGEPHGKPRPQHCQGMDARIYRVVAIIGWIPDSAMSAAHAPCAEHAHAAACCRHSAAVRAEKPQNNCYVWSV